MIVESLWEYHLDLALDENDEEFVDTAVESIEKWNLEFAEETKHIHC